MVRSYKLALVLITILLGVISPFKFSLLAVGGTKPEVGVDFRTEVELEPEDKGLGVGTLSELDLSYEAEFLQVDGEVEMDSDGIADGSLTLGATGSGMSGEAELDLGSGWKSVDSCSFSAEYGPSSNLELSAEYETGNCPGSTNKTPDRELAFDLELEVGDGASADFSTTFSSESGPLVSVPEDSEVELDGLRAGEFILNPVLEAEELDPVELELGYEMREPLLDDPDLSLEGEMAWQFSESYFEFDPEITTRTGVISVESEIRPISTEGSKQFFTIQELELSDLELGSWEFEVTNDLVSEEVELGLITESKTLELELGFLLGGTKETLPVYLDELSGDLTWSPVDNYEVEVTAETGFERIFSELTVVADYSF